MKYAESTQVSADKSRAEIERTLQRYRATGFAYGWQGNTATIAFEMNDRRIRFVLEMEPFESFRTSHAGKRTRSDADCQGAWEQSTRQKWRALSLAVKAKLESVESGLATFEEEFMAHIVLPNNETIGKWMLPQIAEAYQRKTMPPLLGRGQG